MLIIKNKNRILWLITLLILIPSAVSAGVYFIERTDTKAEGYENERPCFVDHPLYGPCPGNKTPQGVCKTDTRYYQRCECDTDVYRFDTTNCTEGKSLGGGSCDGKYETCECDRSIYKYSSSGCASPKVLGGRSCNPLVLESGTVSTDMGSTSGGLAAFASNSGMVNPGGPQMQSPRLYETCTCPAEYKWNTSNCTGNRVLGGGSCDPRNFVSAQPGGPTSGGLAAFASNPVQTNPGDGQQMQSSKLYRTCACPSNYLTCNYGPKAGASECTEGNGDKKYTACNATCEDVGHLTNIPENQTCETVSAVGKLCYKNCRNKTCAEVNGSYKISVPTNQTCTEVKPYDGLKCYTGCRNKTCAEVNGSYKASVPTNQTCTEVIPYDGLKCYKECRALTCADGGYQDVVPTNHTCTEKQYAGLKCYTNCKKNCNVSNCKECVPGNPDVCKVCNSGYDFYVEIEQDGQIYCDYTVNSGSCADAFQMCLKKCDCRYIQCEWIGSGPECENKERCRNGC